MGLLTGWSTVYQTQESLDGILCFNKQRGSPIGLDSIGINMK